MQRSTSQLRWLALLIPVGYLPSYLVGAMPSFGTTMAIIVMTVVAFLAVAWLERRQAEAARRQPPPQFGPPQRGVRPGVPTFGAFNPFGPGPEGTGGGAVTGTGTRTLPGGGPAAPGSGPAAPGGGPAASSTAPGTTPSAASGAGAASPKPPRSIPSWLVALGWPLVIVLGILVYAWVVTAGAVARVNAFGAQESWSVGLFQQALWWTDRGVTLGATSRTIDASLHSFLGIHFSPLLTLLAPMYNAKPEALTLLRAQAVVLALAALPLYLAARLRIGRMGAGFLALAWLLNPTIVGAPLTGFHELAFAPLFAFLAMWAILRRRWFVYLISLVGLLAVREDMAAFVLLLGFAAGAWKAPSRYGTAAFFMGIIWLAAAHFWVMPRYQNPALAGPSGMFAPMAWMGDTPLTAARTVVFQPMTIIRELVSHNSLVYVFSLLRPTGFVLAIPDAGWVAGLQTLIFNLLGRPEVWKDVLGNDSIPLVMALFLALPGALVVWGRQLGVPVPESVGPALAGTIEERGAAVRAAARLGDLWSPKGREPGFLPAAERAGAPAAAVALAAALLGLFTMGISRQFVASPRTDRADQEAILKAVPDSVAVLAPEWAYSRLANRARFSSLRSLERGAHEAATLARFDVILVDVAPWSPDLVRDATGDFGFLSLLQKDAAFSETRTAGYLHLFSRRNPVSAEPAPHPGR